MFSTIKHYLYTTGVAFLAFLGIYLYREGREHERDKLSRDNLDAMKDAKDVRDEVTSDPHFVDRARRWVRDNDG